jgi:hypothetical protein
MSDLVAELLVGAHDMQSSSYTAAAALTIMVYDWFLTLESASPAFDSG